MLPPTPWAKKDMSERDLIAEYRLYLQVEKGLAANTLTSYTTDLAYLSDWAEQCGVASNKLTLTQLRGWIVYLGQTGLAARSVARAVSAARGFFRWLVLDGHLKENPAENLESPDIERQLPNYLSRKEVELLLEQPDTTTPNGLRDRALLELFYATGLRVSEAIGVRLADVEWDAGTLLCHGKGNKQRRLPIGQSALRWLNFYRLERAAMKREKWPNLFLNAHGGPLTRQQVGKMVRGYARTVRLLNVTPHTLRHTCATHLLRGGADSTSLKVLLGHSSIATTQIYTHFGSNRLRETYNSCHPRARAANRPKSEEQGQ